MKIAIVDKNTEYLNDLSDEICSHYYPEEDIFAYKFNNVDEFMKILFDGIHFKIVFLDNDTCDIITVKTVQELLPETIIIGVTDDTSIIPLNNHQLLIKPYTPSSVHNALLHSIKHATIKPNKIKVMHGSRYSYIELQHIYYFESYYGKVYIHTHKNRYLATNQFLYQYTDLLSHYGFVSIHKSILVNMDKIKFATIDEYVLLNDKILYPSVRKRVKAYKDFKKYSDQKAKFPIL
ncbi:MAG: LytR/AlgR family response regulator transcription factor [Coprobacillaceae bacterium]